MIMPTSTVWTDDDCIESDTETPSDSFFLYRVKYEAGVGVPQVDIIMTYNFREIEFNCTAAMQSAIRVLHLIFA